MRFFTLILLLIFILPLHAQVFNTEAERDILIIRTDSFSPSHIPGIYPYIINKAVSGKSDRSWLYRKAFEENFFTWKSDNFDIRIDPAIEFHYGKEGNRTLSQNTRGIVVNGQIEEKFTFRTEFYENQAVFPMYVSNLVDSFEIMPGFVRAKPFGENGFDYGMVFSQLMWQPAKNYAMRFGYDRLHIGEGYRSFVLSDASNAYTFMSHHYARKNWAITHIIASLRNADINGINNVPRSESGAYQQKWLSLTHVSWSPFKFLNISLSENTVFMPWDSTKTSFYPISFIPVPFLRSVLYEKNGPHHVINTLMINWKVIRGIHIYSQFMCDEIKFGHINEYDGIQGAVQLGAKWQNFFGLDNSYIQAEYNMATDNAYTSDSYWTAMTNMDQPLGHPYGQQFIEWILRGQLSRGKFSGNFHYSQIYGYNFPFSDSYYGIDYDAGGPFYFFNSFFKPSLVTHIKFEAAYTVNLMTNLQVFTRFALRYFDAADPTKSVKAKYFTIGIRHKIRNQNYDYF